MPPRLVLAAFAILFVTTSNAFAICPVAIFAPPMRTRVMVVHRYAAPMVAVQAAPVVEVPAPDVEVVAPAPAATVYYRQRTVYRSAPVYMAPAVSADVAVGTTGAQRRHANKSAKHALRAAEHAAKSAYWASRS